MGFIHTGTQRERKINCADKLDYTFCFSFLNHVKIIIKYKEYSNVHKSLSLLWKKASINKKKRFVGYL